MEILNKELITVGGFTIKVSHLLIALAVIVVVNMVRKAS